MDQKSKERLVGAIVIMSILIIFLPMLFAPESEKLGDLNQHTADLLNAENTTELEDQLTHLELAKEKLTKVVVQQTAGIQDDPLEARPPIVSKAVLSKPVGTAVKPVVKSAVKSTVKSTAKPLVNKQSVAPMSAVSSEKGWVLQMGIFGNPKNAKTLTEHLRAKGYQVYSNADSSKGAQITRVFVGPHMSQAAAKQLQAKIKDDCKMQGILVSSDALGSSQRRAG